MLNYVKNEKKNQNRKRKIIQQIFFEIYGNNYLYSFHLYLNYVKDVVNI